MQILYVESGHHDATRDIHTPACRNEIFLIAVSFLFSLRKAKFKPQYDGRKSNFNLVVARANPANIISLWFVFGQTTEIVTELYWICSGSFPIIA